MFVKTCAFFRRAPEIEGFIVSEATGGYYLDDLKVGDTASFGKTVTEADIVLFAGITGDTNPVHLNQDFAAATLFKGRIAHGMLSAGFISTVLGTKLPGPGAIYLSQSLKFKAPVRPGDTVKATVTVTDIVLDRKRVTLSTVCTVGDVVVIEGEAVVMVQPRPVVEPS
jgi:3-hydroxybutyryl-CoA dehydratase